MEEIFFKLQKKYIFNVKMGRNFIKYKKISFYC